MSFLAAIVLTLVFVMTGLVEQFNREPFDAVEAIGAESWLVAEGVSGPFTSVSALPASAANEARLEGQEGASPLVVSRGSLFLDGESDSTEIVIIGHEQGALGTPPVAEGEPALDASSLLLDESAGIDIGESVTIGGSTFTVVGLTEHTTVLAGLPFAFMDISQAQLLSYGNQDTITAVILPNRLAGESPYVERLASEVAEDALGPLEGAIGSLNLIRGLLWMVAAIIIGAVIYLSALERGRDFAVLKAVGASNRELAVGLVVQAVTISLVAAAMAAVLQMLIAPASPLAVRVPARAFWQIPLAAAVISALSSIAGMRRVARSDPSEAFAGAA